jgi:gamma-glutamylcyclotransferase (GGCT)/AIG2-like uncharacterized protein YtfP
MFGDGSMNMRSGTDYRRYGRENYEEGTRRLSDGSPNALRDAFSLLWQAYENYLDDSAVPGETIRDRNANFEDDLQTAGLHAGFVQSVFSCPEAGLLADLTPCIFGEQHFQRTGQKRTDEHNAFSSDYERFRRGHQPKAPLARLLNLLAVVRNNLLHGQKVLPEDFPEMQRRNLEIFKLVAPIQHRLVTLLFETRWADGLFVYGALRPSGPSYGLIRDLVDSVESGYLPRASLYDLCTYTGIVIGSGGIVRGDLLRSVRLHELLNRVDEIEGVQFKRRLVWVHSESNQGQSALAWVYEYTGDLSQATRCGEDL